MHCVLEGVTRWLEKAWLDSKHHGEVFHIGRHVSEVVHYWSNNPLMSLLSLTAQFQSIYVIGRLHS